MELNSHLTILFFLSFHIALNILDNFSRSQNEFLSFLMLRKLGKVRQIEVHKMETFFSSISFTIEVTQQQMMMMKNNGSCYLFGSPGLIHQHVRIIALCVKQVFWAPSASMHRVSFWNLTFHENQIHALQFNLAVACATINSYALFMFYLKTKPKIFILDYPEICDIIKTVIRQPIELLSTKLQIWL